MWFLAFLIGVFVLLRTLITKKINCRGLEINLKKYPVLFFACVVGIVFAIVKCFVSFLKTLNIL